ncbi:hypothetical protein Bbelb_205390 [Branchiostoma belcheri]|nr:hypothetical protein Bbelb_205390 [Branchiostoma belcheri]
MHVNQHQGQGSKPCSASSIKTSYKSYSKLDSPEGPAIRSCFPPPLRSRRAVYHRVSLRSCWQRPALKIPHSPHVDLSPFLPRLLSIQSGGNAALSIHNARFHLAREIPQYASAGPEGDGKMMF